MPTPSSASKPKEPRRRFPLVRALLAAVGLGVLLTVGGFAFAATQEQHDTFCASCHSQPESTFYQRSAASQPVDLASAHTTYKTRCIDCHSGVGVSGRIQAELLGARNAALWVSHTAVQPAPLTQPIRDEACLKCHQNVTVGQGRNNHFHAFLARWQAADPHAGTCTSCHGGHSADSTADNRFVNVQARAVCDACHKVLRKGDD
jgi:predicted CXXCH cytochrome family protein